MEIYKRLPLLKPLYRPLLFLLQMLVLKDLKIDGILCRGLDTNE